MQSHKFAIILAGGEGRRAGGDIPKQFHYLAGHPLVWWAMKAFRDACPDIIIILVVHPGFFDDWDIMCSEMDEHDRIPHVVACGGKSRPHSVYNGLLTVRDILSEQMKSGKDGIAEEFSKNDDCVVAVHDGARALVSPEMIRRGLDGLQPGIGMVPAIPPVNSLRKLDSPEQFKTPGGNQTVVRKDYVEVQTPQIFEFSSLLKAYESAGDFSRFTDDASLYESANHPIALYEGDEYNLKVTHPLDFDFAEIILKRVRSVKNL